MKLTIKNGEINSFANFLLELELKGKKSRLRTRFIKVLVERQKLVQEEQMVLIKEHCHLDEEDNPKKIKNENGEFWDIKDVASYQSDVEEMLEECFIIDGEDKREMLTIIKEAVLDCDKLFSGQEALMYDQWCEIVERIED